MAEDAEITSILSLLGLSPETANPDAPVVPGEGGNAMDTNLAIDMSNDVNVTVSAGSEVEVNLVAPAVVPVEGYPDLSHLTTVKLPHSNLILHGVCDHCAHCGLALTDAESIQRGIGPICYGKGYSEEVDANGDELQAMIDLAEFPELVTFLTEHYKPLGIRGLVNGLVRTASLNRPRGQRNFREGNEKVFAACCDSIESLGHKKMATLLRNTLAIASIKDSEVHPGCLEIWVKKAEWTWNWSTDCRNFLSGTFFDRKCKAMIVPVFHPDHVGDPQYRRGSQVAGKTNKSQLWILLQKHYGGLVIKTKDGAAKIPMP